METLLSAQSDWCNFRTRRSARPCKILEIQSAISPKPQLSGNVFVLEHAPVRVPTGNPCTPRRPASVAGRNCDRSRRCSGVRRRMQVALTHRGVFKRPEEPVPKTLRKRGLRNPTTALFGISKLVFRIQCFSEHFRQRQIGRILVKRFVHRTKPFLAGDAVSPKRVVWQNGGH